MSSGDADGSGVIEPFVARVLRAEWAARVISPPYDSMSDVERERWAAEHPDSFLHVASGAALTQGHPSEHFAAAVRGKAALARLIEQGAYGEPTPPRLFAQEVTVGELRQQAVLGAVRLEGADLRAHEATHPARVQGLATHLVEVGTMASPVVVTPARSSATVDALNDVLRSTLAGGPAEGGLAESELAEGEPHGEQMLRVTSADDAHIRVVAVDAELVASVGESSSSASVTLDGPLYIIDGHHRVAAAVQAGLKGLFVAVVPPEQVTLRGFDRTVSVLEVMPRRLLAQLSAWCDVNEVGARADAQPSERGVIGVRLAHRWYRAVRRAPSAAAGDSDAGFVHDVLLPELFNITVHTDDRLGYRVTFGPSAGVSASGPPALGSSPTASAEPPVEILLAGASLDDVYAVADAGGTMPPKSTYFMPKARSGVVLMPT